MAENISQVAKLSQREGQAREALQRIEALVIDGLRHGHFEYTLACDIGSGGKRQLVIRAGKSHKFLIAPEEVQR